MSFNMVITKIYDKTDTKNEDKSNTCKGSDHPKSLSAFSIDFYNNF